MPLGLFLLINARSNMPTMHSLSWVNERSHSNSIRYQLVLMFSVRILISLQMNNCWSRISHYDHTTWCALVRAPRGLISLKRRTATASKTMLCRAPSSVSRGWTKVGPIDWTAPSNFWSSTWWCHAECLSHMKFKWILSVSGDHAADAAPAVVERDVGTQPACCPSRILIGL